MMRMPDDPRQQQRRQLFTQLQQPPDGGAVAETMAPPPPPPAIQPMGAQRAQPRSVPGPGIQPVSTGGPRQQQYGITPGAISGVPSPGQSSSTPAGNNALTFDPAAQGAAESPFGKQHNPFDAASDPRGWFMKMTEGKPANSDTLKSLAGMLPPGWKLGNPNASGMVDSIILPDGRVIDVGQAFSTNSGKWQWGDWGPGDGGGSGSGLSGGSGGGMPVNPMGGGGSAGPGGDFNGQVRSMLMEQLKGMGQTPGAEDPIIKNQVDAYRNEKTRASQAQRAALAERAAASGLNSGGAGSGAFESGVGGILEAQGEDVGQFSAGAVSKELYSRRDKMTQLMHMALQTGDNEMARNLQMQIAQMDNQLRYATLGEQGRQFDAGLGENRRQFDDNFGRGLGRDAEDDQRWRLEFGF